MGRLYLSLVDPCRREVDDRDGKVQRCPHGFVMAAQRQFADLPQATSFQQAADSSPAWTNAMIAQEGERNVERLAVDKVMGSRLNKIISGIVKAVESQEEVV